MSDVKTFEAPAHRSDLLRLPTGDWINIYAVEAARNLMADLTHREGDDA